MAGAIANRAANGKATFLKRTVVLGYGDMRRAHKTSKVSYDVEKMEFRRGFEDILDTA